MWSRNPETLPFIYQWLEGVGLCHNIEELLIFDLQKSLSSVLELA